MMIVLGSILIALLLVGVFVLGMLAGGFALDREIKENKKFKEEAAKREEAAIKREIEATKREEAAIKRETEAIKRETAFKLAIMEKDNLIIKIMLAGVNSNSSPEIWGVDSTLTAEETSKTREFLKMIESNSAETDIWIDKIKRQLFGVSSEDDKDTE